MNGIDSGDLFRLFTLCLAFANILAWMYLIRINKRVWPAVCLPVVLFCHYIAFFAVAIDRSSVPSLDLTLWANGLFVHSMTTWIVSAFVMARVMRRGLYESK